MNDFLPLAPSFFFQAAHIQAVHLGPTFPSIVDVVRKIQRLNPKGVLQLFKKQKVQKRVSGCWLPSGKHTKNYGKSP